eukprot:EG_transcript_23413
MISTIAEEAKHTPLEAERAARISTPDASIVASSGEAPAKRRGRPRKRTPDNTAATATGTDAQASQPSAMAATTRRRQGTSQATRSGTPAALPAGSAPSPTAAKAAPASKPGAAAGKKRSRARVANGKTRGTADEAASTVPVPP